MSILARLRAEGVVFGTEGGQLVLEHVDERQIGLARPHKDEILAVLRRERIAGPSYEHSALRWRLDALAEDLAVYREAGIAGQLCTAALNVLWDVEEVLLQDMRRGVAALLDARDGLMALLHKIEDEKKQSLTGKALHETARLILTAPGKVNKNALT